MGMGKQVLVQVGVGEVFRPKRLETPIDRLTRVAEMLDIEIEKLSVDDAILKLEKLDEEFMVLANRATDALHVVYKLPDGNYGVLNLEASS